MPVLLMMSAMVAPCSRSSWARSSWVEAGIQLPLRMTKSCHTGLGSLAVYAKPTFDAVSAATAALDPDRRRR